MLLASDITSIRLAVKLAMYSTPRASSSARSAASPPIGDHGSERAAERRARHQHYASQCQNPRLTKHT